MLPVRNISYLLPMCCSFWEKCKNSPKTGLGCSTPLRNKREDIQHTGGVLFIGTSYLVQIKKKRKDDWMCWFEVVNSNLPRPVCYVRVQDALFLLDLLHMHFFSAIIPSWLSCILNLTWCVRLIIIIIRL